MVSQARQVDVHLLEKEDSEAVSPRVQKFEAAVRRLRDGGIEAILQATHALLPNIAARASHHDRTGTYPSETFEELWQAGLTSLSLPVELGGVGATFTDTAKALQLIATVDGSTAFLLKAHVSGLRDGGRNWPEPLRSDFHKAILEGPAHRSGSRSDKQGGSAARGGLPRATAQLITQADGKKYWKINAHKAYATGSIEAGWFGVWAATAPEDGDILVGTFLVPANTPGFQVLEGSWDQLGMRATVSNDILLEDVIIPQEYAMGLAPFGQRNPADARNAITRTTDWTSALEAAVYSGLAIGARDWLVQHLNERIPASLGKPLSTLPKFQEAVGEIELLIYNNKLVIDDISRRIEAHANGTGEPVTMVEGGLARVKAVRNSLEAIDKAVSLVGNAGLAYRYPLQRHFRDILCGRVHEPQAEVLLTHKGKAALGV
ncbi:MAG: acyl-CoA dehydrogenase family protein [Asticcacaulis sp.]